MSKGKGIFRIDDWWRSKAAFLMGLVYLFILWFKRPFEFFEVLGFFSLLTITGFASLGYLFNDLFDIRQDQIAGKSNFLAGKNPLLIISLFIISGLLVFGPWLVLPANNISFALIAFEIFLFIIYSSPPIRLKERGIAGIVVDSLYAHAVPATLAAYTFSLGAVSYVHKFALVLLFLWQFIAGMRNIVLHQLSDAESDKTAGVRNYVSALSQSRQSMLVTYAIVGEIVFAMAFFFRLSLYDSRFVFCLALISAFSVIALGLFYKKGMAAMIVSKWRYFPNNVYEKWLPPLLLILLSFYNRWFIAVLVVHIAVFNFDVYVKIAANLALYARLLYPRLEIFWNDFIFASGSVVVNYSIYYLFLLFGINLRNEKTSALAYFKKRKGKTG